MTGTIRSVTPALPWQKKKGPKRGCEQCGKTGGKLSYRNIGFWAWLCPRCRGEGE